MRFVTDSRILASDGKRSGDFRKLSCMLEHMPKPVQSGIGNGQTGEMPD